MAIMRMIKKMAAVLLLLVAAPGIVVHAATSASGTNGVRLVSGTAATASRINGRLEVLTVSWPYGGYTKKPVWVPMCDADINDDTATIMCNLLGWKYGRKHYAANVTYASKNTIDPPGGAIFCNSPSPPGRGAHRHRLLRDGSEGEGVGQLNKAVEAGGHEGLVHRVTERSLTPWMADIKTSPSSPYSCRFAMGYCSLRGPFAGLECFKSTMPPALSPPPRPPSQPPSPPPASLYIRFIGQPGFPLTSSPLEPNLCPSQEFCTTYGRVEVQVPAPTNKTRLIWAPVCAPKTSAVLDKLAEMVCQQLLDWPALTSGGNPQVFAKASSDPFKIPGGNVTTYNQGDFNPSKVDGWMYISSIPTTIPRRIQDLNIKVNTTRCNLLALSCIVIMI